MAAKKASRAPKTADTARKIKPLKSSLNAKVGELMFEMRLEQSTEGRTLLRACRVLATEMYPKLASGNPKES